MAASSSPTSASRGSSRPTARAPTSSWARRATSRRSSTSAATSTTAWTSSPPAWCSISCWRASRRFAAGPRRSCTTSAITIPKPASKADPAHRWPQYDAIVARAIAKAPADRFQSAGEFRSAILDAYAQPVANTISEATIVTHRSRSVFADAGGGSGSGWRRRRRRHPRRFTVSSSSSPPPTGWSGVGAVRRRDRDRQVHRAGGQGAGAPRRQGAQGPRVAGGLADAGASTTPRSARRLRARCSASR